jgi:hypothetical protein
MLCISLVSHVSYDMFHVLQIESHMLPCDVSYQVWLYFKVMFHRFLSMFHMFHIHVLHVSWNTNDNIV